jgi:hypothetical protein
MTAGQHKGVMLRTLLHRTDSSFKAIVFVDDHKEHTVRVQAAFRDQPVRVVTFRYGKEDENVKRFIAGDKSAVSQAWSDLAAITGRLFRAPAMPEPVPAK